MARVESVFYNNITQIELELTTRCNAACPQCSRNYYGGKTWPSLPITDLNLSWLKEHLPAEALAGMKEIRLCGTYGDPCIHPKLIEIVSWLHSVSNAQITIRTNGGMRGADWWAKLAKVLRSTDIVFFGIDGLKDTNHLYRIGTSWGKIMNNSQAFIANGGNAVWSYLVFEHNEHQIEKAEQLSIELGFKGFATKITSRFMDKTHKFIDKSPVMDKDSNVIRWLKPATQSQFQNQGYTAYDSIVEKHGTYDNYLQTVPISCMARHTGLVCISAEGYVLPCGWLLDRFYGFEAESHYDRARLINLIDSAGGINAINLSYTKYNDIVNGPVFTALAESWVNKYRLERCAHQCGQGTQLSSSAISKLKKFWQGTALE